MQRVAPERVVQASAGVIDRAGSAAAPPGRSGEHLAYLDNLKTLLIAGINAGHAIMGYAKFGSWTYQDVKEVTVSPITEVILAVAVVSLGGPWPGRSSRGRPYAACCDDQPADSGLPMVGLRQCLPSRFRRALIDETDGAW